MVLCDVAGSLAKHTKSKLWLFGSIRNIYELTLHLSITSSIQFEIITLAAIRMWYEYVCVCLCEMWSNFQIYGDDLKWWTWIQSCIAIGVVVFVGFDNCVFGFALIMVGRDCIAATVFVRRFRGHVCVCVCFIRTISRPMHVCVLSPGVQQWGGRWEDGISRRVGPSARPCRVCATARHAAGGGGGVRGCGGGLHKILTEVCGTQQPQYS